MPGALDFLKQRLAELEQQGLLLRPRTLDGPTGARARFDGRDVMAGNPRLLAQLRPVMAFCSNSFVLQSRRRRPPDVVVATARLRPARDTSGTPGRSKNRLAAARRLSNLSV